MNTAEIVVHVVQGDSSNMIFDLLRERVGEPSEAAHLHSHGEVLALDIAGADVLRIGLADFGFFFGFVRKICG